MNASLVLIAPEVGLLPPKPRLPLGLPLPRVPADVGRLLPRPGLLEEDGRPNDDDVEGRTPDPPRGKLEPEGLGEPTRPPWGRPAGTVLKALKPAGPGLPLWPLKG